MLLNEQGSIYITHCWYTVLALKSLKQGKYVPQEYNSFPFSLWFSKPCIFQSTALGCHVFVFLTYLSIPFSQLNQSDLCIRRGTAQQTVKLHGSDYVLHPVHSCCTQRGLVEKMRLPCPPFPSQPPTYKICTWVCFGSIAPLLHSIQQVLWDADYNIWDCFFSCSFCRRGKCYL